VEGDILVVVDQVAHDRLWTFVDTHNLDEAIFMNKDDADMEFRDVHQNEKVTDTI
jgi:hypothetical protein